MISWRNVSIACVFCKQGKVAAKIDEKGEAMLLIMCPVFVARLFFILFLNVKRG